MEKIKAYLIKNLIAWDMAICALWPWSKERETISGFLGRVYRGSFAEKSVDWIFYKMGWWQDDDHCMDVSSEESKFIK